MKEQKVFTCQLTGYYIEYIIDSSKQIALLNTIICDYVHINQFCALLKVSIEKLKEDYNIKEIIQTISSEEWELYLENKTTWKIIEKSYDKSIYDIVCNIDDFLSNFGIGIGLDYLIDK